MKLQERCPLYVKWVIVWLVILPLILYYAKNSGVFASAWVCPVVIGAGFGLCVPLVDRVFLFILPVMEKIETSRGLFLDAIPLPARVLFSGEVKAEYV
ncbi:hypothetical protein HRW30_005075 [Salmonella enterica]|nr:hypothetical protein [Salmonella enterica]ELD8112318.1 hypothetical protein [Salmonella enterica subsp. enterica serovar Benin]EBC1279723.1 hypothetical protein [Salmonella enterica]EBE7296595.1 hypothetical protein [Salmonella enterica]EFU9296095.1 hypothetical protein [Salmonella enterica]